jgi:hypothetical protein
MKLLKVSVPDPTRPEFLEETERQAKLLRGPTEERRRLISSNRLSYGLNLEGRRSLDPLHPAALRKSTFPAGQKGSPHLCFSRQSGAT